MVVEHLEPLHALACVPIDHPGLAVDGTVLVEAPERRTVLIVHVEFEPCLTVLNGPEGVAVTLLRVVVDGWLVVGDDFEGMLDRGDSPVNVGELTVVRELLAPHVDPHDLVLGQEFVIQHLVDVSHAIEVRDQLSPPLVEDSPNNLLRGHAVAALQLVASHAILARFPLQGDQQHLPAAILLIKRGDEARDGVDERLVVEDVGIRDHHAPLVRVLDQVPVPIDDAHAGNHRVVRPRKHRPLHEGVCSEIVHLRRPEEPGPGGEVEVRSNRVRIGEEALVDHSLVHHDQLLDLVKAHLVPRGRAHNPKPLNLHKPVLQRLLREARRV
mmetsp:Transcript_20079/g.49324  ORF Transcript_20079/g.49324 Transcript_20079/m.49324 type:complete len:326 (-) Transcript_20079:1254-2231(-)